MISYYLFHADKTERRGRVVSTLASYSGKSWVQILAQKMAVITEGFRDFPGSLGAIASFHTLSNLLLANHSTIDTL
jgi:hypothetical protein